MTEVMDALGGVASLAGASRALAAALVRAGALGAAASLARRFALAHRDQREDRAALAAPLMQAVLRAVGRHVPEVRARLAASPLPACGRWWAEACGRRGWRPRCCWMIWTTRAAACVPRAAPARLCVPIGPPQHAHALDDAHAPGTLLARLGLGA